MYTALRALMFGEDFTSDPVSRVLGYVLRYFSHGHLAINVQLVSQVRHVAGLAGEAFTIIGSALSAAYCSECIHHSAVACQSWRLEDGFHPARACGHSHAWQQRLYRLSWLPCSI